MDKYNTRVHDIAEEMAKAQYEKVHSDLQIGPPFNMMGKSKVDWEGPLTKKLLPVLIDQKLPDARIAVRRIADGIREYVIECAAVPALPGYTVEQYLKEQGLIPDQEAGRDETK